MSKMKRYAEEMMRMQDDVAFQREEILLLNQRIKLAEEALGRILDICDRADLHMFQPQAALTQIKDVCVRQYKSRPAGNPATKSKNWKDDKDRDSEMRTPYDV